MKTNTEPTASVKPADDAKSMLLEAGLRIFGLNGFEGVRTRSLADAAGVNQSAIPYYFGGKKGLYLAVAESLAENVRNHFLKKAVERTKGVKTMSKEKTATTFKLVMTDFTRTMLGNQTANPRSAFLAREQLQPTEAFEILFKHFFQPFHRIISRLAGRMLDLDEDNPEVILIAHAIVGMSISFSVAKETYLRCQNIEDLSETQINHIASTLGDLALRICG
jgi:AcrR family transcriptional regulator